MSNSLLSTVTRAAPSLPSRLVLYAAEKFGKTSFAAHAPAPVFLMTAGETGLLSLMEAGRVGPTDHFPDDFKSWDQLQEAVRALRRDPHQFKTLVLDTANGAEQLCQRHVCDSMFNGSWSDYQDYGKGDVQAAKEWGAFLRTLDDLRTARKMAVVFLHHARVKTFANPAGKDWDQWRPECMEKCWALTHKWADVILFGGFKVNVVKDKATGETRYLRANASAAIVAGNRYGLPDEITAPAGADHLWRAFAIALQKSKSAGKPVDPPKGNEPAKEPQSTPSTDQASPPRDRDPGEDDGKEDEDSTHDTGDPVGGVPFGGRLPDEVCEALLKDVHAAGLTWDQVVTEGLGVIGRRLLRDAHISSLSLDEAGRVRTWVRERGKAKGRKEPAAA
jgi:hypothetical protein